MKKTIATLAALMAIMTALAGCSPSTGQQPNNTDPGYSIGILQIIDHVALDASRQGFIDQLGKLGYKEGENLTINYQNAQGDQSNLKAMAQKLVNEKPSLILAIATPSAQSVASETTEIPIVLTAVTDPKESGLVASNEKPDGNITGMSDLTPIAKQIELLVKLLPNAKKIGIMYSSGESNSVIQANIAKAELAKYPVTVEEATVASTNDVAQVAQTLSGKVDAIYIPTDNILASAITQVSSICNEKKVPVIVGEEGMVDGGGLITDGINYYNLGVETANMAAKILKGEAKPADMPIQYLESTTIVINMDQAQILGITIPDDILSTAGRLVKTGQ